MLAATSWSVPGSARAVPPPVAVVLPVMVVSVTGAAATVSIPVAAAVAVPAAVPAVVAIALPVAAGVQARHSAACNCSADHG